MIPLEIILGILEQELNIKLEGFFTDTIFCITLYCQMNIL